MPKIIGRIQLDLDDLDNVSGGQLTVRQNDDGTAVIERVNSNYQVIQKVDVIGNPEQVFAEIQQVYWGYEKGKRDSETLKHLYKNGMISLPK